MLDCFAGYQRRSNGTLDMMLEEGGLHTMMYDFDLSGVPRRVGGDDKEEVRKVQRFAELKLVCVGRSPDKREASDGYHVTFIHDHRKSPNERDVCSTS
jgi:hypothetical protein